MGLFDFIKEAGKALGIGGDDEPPTGDQLKEELDSHDLGTEDVTVEVDGDRAIVKGSVKDQTAFEKMVVAVGNTLGISQVETEVDVAEPADTEPVMHTVQKGDTLWAIATKHYGNGAKYNAIFEANKPMLKHPDKIYPGQVLRIPPEE